MKVGSIKRILQKNRYLSQFGNYFTKKKRRNYFMKLILLKSCRFLCHSLKILYVLYIYKGIVCKFITSTYSNQKMQILFKNNYVNVQQSDKTLPPVASARIESIIMTANNKDLKELSSRMPPTFPYRVTSEVISSPYPPPLKKKASAPAAAARKK